MFLEFQSVRERVVSTLSRRLRHSSCRSMRNNHVGSEVQATRVAARPLINLPGESRRQLQLHWTRGSQFLQGMEITRRGALSQNERGQMTKTTPTGLLEGGELDCLSLHWFIRKHGILPSHRLVVHRVELISCRVMTRSSWNRYRCCRFFWLLNLDFLTEHSYWVLYFVCLDTIRIRLKTFRLMEPMQISCLFETQVQITTRFRAPAT
jgi:hypothetical protein